MMIHEITQKVARYKPRKRVGRGESSGMGKTSGRGSKGAKSRSGWSLPPQYQGGQINFIQKMPKRGFSNAPFKVVYHVVNIKALEALADVGEEITAQSLAAAGLIRDSKQPLKILGEGELTKKLTIKADKFSASAKAKIEAAGGTANQIKKSTWNRDPEAFAARTARRAAAKAARAATPVSASTAPSKDAPSQKSSAKTPKKDKAPKPQQE